MKGGRHIAGFSLVEVMCAILILGVALVGLTQGARLPSKAVCC